MLYVLCQSMFDEYFCVFCGTNILWSIEFYAEIESVYMCQEKSQNRLNENG